MQSMNDLVIKEKIWREHVGKEIRDSGNFENRYGFLRGKHIQAIDMTSHDPAGDLLLSSNDYHSLPSSNSELSYSDHKIHNGSNQQISAIYITSGDDIGRRSANNLELFGVNQYGRTIDNSLMPQYRSIKKSS